MNKVISLLICFLFCFSFAKVNASELVDSFAIEFGDADDSVDVYRIAVQKDFTDWLEARNIPLEGFFEASVSYWQGAEDDLFAIALAPVLRKSFCKECNFRPYIELGVGVALLSEDEIDEIDMSSNFQFENRIGIGVKTENVDTHLRLMHYSNAGISSPNDGINILLLGFEYKFLNMSKDMHKAKR